MYLAIYTSSSFDPFRRSRDTAPGNGASLGCIKASLCLIRLLDPFTIFIMSDKKTTTINSALDELAQKKVEGSLTFYNYDPSTLLQFTAGDGKVMATWTAVAPEGSTLDASTTRKHAYGIAEDTASGLKFLKSWTPGKDYEEGLFFGGGRGRDDLYHAGDRAHEAIYRARNRCEPILTSTTGVPASYWTNASIPPTIPVKETVVDPRHSKYTWCVMTNGDLAGARSEKENASSSAVSS